MPEIDPVILQLRADLRDYSTRLKQADRLADQHLGSIERRGDVMGRRIGGSFSLATKAALAFGGALAAMQLVDLGRQAVETALRFKRFEQGLAVAVGSSAAATREIAFLRDMADRLGLRFITLAENFTGLAAAARGTALEGKATREVFEAITKAIVATGGSTEQVNGALLAVQQIMSKGSVSAEELRGQLGERLPGAFQIAARAMGVTTAELGKMLEAGSVASTDFLPKFAAQLGKELPGSLETADASFQRFQTALDDIANSTADGFMKQLGAATDDLTKTLKDLQSSGALEAIGSFLGEVIRLGSGAVRVVGDLALAWKRFTLEKGVRQQDNVIDGWATSDQQKADAQRKKALFEAELYRMDNPGRKSGFQKSKDSLDALVGSWGGQSGSGGTSAAPSGGGGKTPRKSGGGRSGPSAAQIAQRAAQDLERLELEEMRARLDLTASTTERAQIQADILAREKQARLSEIKAGSPLADARKALIDALYGQEAVIDKDTGEIVTQGKIGLLARQALNEQFERETRQANDLLSIQADTLQSWADIEPNARDRAKLEKAALEIHQRIERNLLAMELSTGALAGLTAEEKSLVRDRVADQQEAARRRLELENMTPGQRYRQELNTSIGNINDSIEDIEAQGLDALNDGLAQAIMGTKSLGDVFHDVAGQIIADLLRIAIQKSIIGPLADAIFGGASLFGGGGGSNASSAGSFLSSTGKLWGKASGGPVNAGQMYRVNEIGMEYFKPNVPGEIIPLSRQGVPSGGGAPVTQHITIQVDAQGALLASQVQSMVREGVQVASQIGINGGAAKAKSDIYGRSRRTIPR